MTMIDAQLEAVKHLSQSIRRLNEVMDLWLLDEAHLNVTCVTRREAMQVMNAVKDALEAIAALCGSDGR